jgi:DNA modification methylase
MRVDRVHVEDQVVYLKSSERMTELRPGEVDLIVTSPPYWNLKDYEHPGQIGQEDYEAYLRRLDAVWRECHRVSGPGAVLAINVNSRRHRKVFYPLAFDIHRTISNWVLVDVLIWYIPNALPQPNYYLERVHDNKFEFVLVFAKDYEYRYTFNKVRVPQKYRTHDPRAGKHHWRGRGIGNVIRIPAYRPPTIRQGNYHAAAFPEELPYYLIHTYSNPGDLVLDPFAGSGTTLKVARNLLRPGVGYEVNPDLAPLLARRLAEAWEPPPFTTLDIISVYDPDPEDHRPRVPRVAGRGDDHGGGDRR